MARTAAGWTGLPFATAVVAALAGCGGGSPTPSSSPAPASAEAPAGTPTGAPTGTAGATATATAAATPAAVTNTAPASVSKAFADQVLEAVNAARATPRRCGTSEHAAAGPVRWNAQVELAALAHAQYLQQHNLFSHTGANGSSVGDRVTATGYVWQTVGENIAAGYPDLAAVVQGWIDSPSHCVNVMSGNFTDLGVVVVPGTSANTYRNYWAMVLARPR
jgi:uncharacterized protein YkwD